jgi:uncharacterized membrane protein YraQ (UPF0718 family)
MAPYLLFGFLGAGILSQLISRSFIQNHLGHNASYPELKAALFGVPMPICSCGVLPLAAGLRRQGASASSTASFLASTPQTGIDSLLVTYALLGWVFALFRAIVAFVSGILCGWSIRLIKTPPQNTAPSTHIIEKSALRDRCISACKYGFITLPKDIARPLLLGLILSGVLTVFLPETPFSNHLAHPLLSMLVMILIGLPLYICSSASVPLAYAFIQSGVPSGAVLVFLIMGPATNIATLTTLHKLIGARATVLFFIVLISTALIAGSCMTYYSPKLGLEAAFCDAHGATNQYQILAAILLLGLLLNGIRLKK